MDRNETSDSIVRVFGEEVLKFQELLCKEKKEREEEHGKILTVLEQLNDAISFDISGEKKGRETSEEMLLKLLEETCSKIEHSLLQDDDSAL